VGRMSGARLGAGVTCAPDCGHTAVRRDRTQHDCVARDNGFAVLAHRARRSGLNSGARTPLVLAAFGIATWAAHCVRVRNDE